MTKLELNYQGVDIFSNGLEYYFYIGQKRYAQRSLDKSSNLEYFASSGLNEDDIKDIQLFCAKRSINYFHGNKDFYE